MAQTYPIRTAGAEDFDALYRVLEHAFASPPEPEEVRASEWEVLELDRTLGVFDGDEPVGCATAYSFQMTVPGGRAVPTAGVSWVAVLPTHRRRGILSALMRRQLDDIREDNREPLAALWASESPIYGRFGYGLASTALRLSVPREHNRLRDVPGAEGLRVRLVDNEASLEPARAVYEAATASRAGMLHLPSDAWRRATILDPEGRREGASPLRTLLVEDEAGGARAYARYSTKPSWSRAGAGGTTRVRELVSRDAAAAAAAWRYLLDLDLVTALEARNRPVDDALLHLLLNPRAAKPELGDALYLRLVDLPAALEARTYAAAVEVVLEVSDEYCGWNRGRWRLQVGEDGTARCERTAEEADIHLSARDLGACYLGGTTLGSLADAGLVTEHAQGRVDALSRAMRAERAPWCCYGF